jgi:hypothetical protein
MHIGIEIEKITTNNDTDFDTELNRLNNPTNPKATNWVEGLAVWRP